MDNKQYNHRIIESYWQSEWEKDDVFAATETSTKKKFYVLGMFPYPSGAGLHIGHSLVYTITDVIARYKRLMGFNVLNPMGWDSFGLPAERYAMKMCQHPHTITTSNVAQFKHQLKSLGCSYAWDRETYTSDSLYYKWTQWLFIQLYKHNLAIYKDTKVLYCPKLKSVVANEEVHNGYTEHGYEVISANKKQWVLKISKYAPQLLQDLDLLDWPECIKDIQRNWIGKQSGYAIKLHIKHRLNDHDIPVDNITVFVTTMKQFEHMAAVYVDWDSVIGSLSRSLDITVDKFAKQFEGMAPHELYTQKLKGIISQLQIFNPVTNQVLPIIVTNYLSVDYGFDGAPCLPHHVEQDYFLCTQLNISITTSPLYMDPIKNNVATKTVCYKIKDWIFSRQRYWGEPIPILHLANGTIRPLEEEELPLELPPYQENSRESIDNHQNDCLSELEKNTEWLHTFDKKTCMSANRDANVMPQWAGSCWYYLRFCDPHNNMKPWSLEKENYWMPVDVYVGGTEHAVLHLLYARFWHKVFYDIGLVSTPEPFKKLVVHGLVCAASYKDTDGNYYPPDEVTSASHKKFIHNPTGKEVLQSFEKMSKSKLNGIMPNDIIDTYGADALRMYLLFMGPIEQNRKWDTQSITGCRRFLCRLLHLTKSSIIQNKYSDACHKITHDLITKVSVFYKDMKFNLVVSAFMESFNSIKQLEYIDRLELIKWTIMLSPIAPHIAEEMWKILGQDGYVCQQKFPQTSTQEDSDNVCKYIIQINGKFKVTYSAHKGLSQDRLLEQIKNNSTINRILPSSFTSVFVQDKVLNLLTD